MSADHVSDLAPAARVLGADRRPRRRSWWFAISSLRLTVVLLSLALLLIFLGTLAQVEKNMIDVLNDYFGAWFAWVEWKVLVPESFFSRQVHQAVVDRFPGGFYFPGGALIGTGLLVNLISAHLTRFRVQSRGGRRGAGVLILTLGFILTWFIIAWGHNPHGLQSQPVAGLWPLLQLGLSLAWLLSLAGAVMYRGPQPVRLGFVLTAAVLGGLLVWMLAVGSEAKLNDSSLRILWQLLQGGVAGIVTCAGCYLLFSQRAGIVTLHLGVGLLMLSQLFVTLYDVEERMQITEGETVNFASDIRTLELAIVDREDPRHVTVVPRDVLLSGARPSAWSRLLAGGSSVATRPRISHPDLPFDLELVQYFKNSEVLPVDSSSTDAESDRPATDDNPATAGQGLRVRAVPARAAGGADGSEVDQASCYVRFFHQGTDDEIGTYLFSQKGLPNQQLMRWEYFDHETIAWDDEQKRSSDDSTEGLPQKSFDVTWRFKRSYKPYSMHLLDVRKDDYIGTSTPRNYSSDVRLIDASRGEDRQIRIWMNNPLRYAGETFYQSNYAVAPDGREVTDLQVVTNRGWMAPYVACMYVAVGLLFHFSGVLLRFLRRREASAQVPSHVETDVELGVTRQQKRKRRRRSEELSSTPRRPWAHWMVPAGFVALFLFYLASASRPRTLEYDGVDLTEFAQLPIVYEGRTEPLDTLARNGLLVISGRETFDDGRPGPESWSTRLFGKKGQPAIGWMADLASNRQDREGQRVVDAYKVFRIENFDVLDLLGLEPRQRFRYALAEFRDKLDQLSQEVRKARDMEPAARSTYEGKLIELDNRLRTYMKLQYAFQPIPFPAVPTREEFESNRDVAMETVERIRDLMARAPEYTRELAAMHPPLAVPNEKKEGDPWQPYATAHYLAYVAPVLKQDVNPATVAWDKFLHAYAEGDATTFEREVRDYHRWIGGQTAIDLHPTRIRFETFFNSFRPFMQASVMYLLAFMLSVASWLGWRSPLSRSALSLIVIAFLVHTFAVVGRIYISGRPPVTNLYSSAVFIGWGGVLLGMLLEATYHLGIGNVVSTVAGFATLRVADGLARDGDTFTVLQAVLDTQFWLSTHVTCITFGYATTLVAGLLGALYLLANIFAPRQDSEWKRALPRMTYGILCFSIFFTFIGTVLGGLWADDSWGRFWGWDPKENGALMIVLWNAIILHARWGKMVGPTGLSVLAVLGNVVVTWSWFGTNELGIGLHAYGFREGMVRNLWMFWASQWALAGAGLLMTWLSRSAPQGTSVEDVTAV